MKIALVSPYDFAYPGGVVNHICALEHHFTRMGHEVKIIAPASRVIPDFGDRFIPIGRPRPIPTSGSIARVTISVWLSSKVKAVLDTENFDVIHLHEPLMPMLCTTVLRLSNTTNVGTFHAVAGRPGYDFGKPLATILLRKWFRRLNGRIAVSKPAMEFASRYFPGDYHIIPNGVDLKHFSADVPPIDKFMDGKLNIVFISRLEKRKGFDYLLQAYQRVKKEIPNSRLIAVGPGTRLRHKYEKWVARNNVEDVVFIGYVSYDELPRYYKTADIFCVPATGHESFGIILLEAMAAGKPIVATSIEGYATLINDGVEGFLVPPRDVGRLAQALLSLLTDGSLRKKMGAEGRAKVVDYDWEHVAQRVLTYYNSVLSGTEATPGV
ncbi:MAG: glycosyltransferase family 4 protein [Dehalococcoidales bacterium]|nr:glycosyltransferase family 4 protein [Dehalococcoidales bacterium]